MKPSPAVTWAVATLMVTVVSCCSLVGVSIMPLISGPSYKIFITLFTGLAVGSLLGSAIFSLIPQAFGLVVQDNKAYLWKSLVIFLGIYLFYTSERLMRMYLDRRNKKDKVSSTTAVAIADTSEAKQVGGDSKHDHNIHLHNYDHHNHRQPSSNADDNRDSPPSAIKKSTIAPLAWMIIIGDGLHNLIDGLSIGAAFSESISLGLSTSIAVIFEEFPHELGDFAVLIASGMTVKQALCFNFLSACTCYIGMIFGIMLGNMTSGASYIFALAGGMFLYISLVDMMGELSAMLEEFRGSTRKTAQLLLMQNTGILLGIVIVFLLSLFSNA